MDTTSDARLDATPSRRLRGQLLLLRGRSGLTQRALATLLGVSEAAIQNWEAGRGYPSPARLQALIALYLQRGVFPAGHEDTEARALWKALRQETSQRTPPFDDTWFAALQLREGAADAAPLVVVAEVAAPPERPAAARPDWGEAPDVAAFLGRETELQTLKRWLLEEHGRVVALLGLGGIGKTALASRLAEDLASHYEGLCWRSLRNAPPPEEWLREAIAALAPVPPVLPAGLPARLGLLLALLRERRCLLVLDNLETVLESGAVAGRYRASYEGYGEVLRQVGESRHQSCLLLTTREASPELALLAGDRAPLRMLRLGGLDLLAARTLLADKGLMGDDHAWGTLVASYGGNPLALQVVGQSIAELFGGEIAPFLAYVTETHGAVFGDLRRLLDDQVERLAPLEQRVLYWLAVEREPVKVTTLPADPGAGHGALLEAVAGLGRRSLLERGAQGGTHTLQPVVLEYATERLVEEVGREIVAGEPRLLVSHALVQAQAKDYVRRSQERLIAEPLLEQLRATSHSAEAVEQRLLELLAGWRGRPAGEQGFGPGTAVNLLRLLRGDLRGLDLSHLAIRQAYLAEVEAQGASLAGAHLSQAVLAEAFAYPDSVALSVDGTLLAAGTNAGEVFLWRVGDRTPLLAVQGHAGAVHDVALSGDGAVLASGSFDQTVKLWQVADGQLLTTLHGHTAGVLGVALARDGQLVASASQDGTVRLWETGSGRLSATLPVHPGGVWSVALSAEGRLLVSGNLDGTVTLYDVASGQVCATWQVHAGGGGGLALSGDGTWLACGSGDGTITLWELPGRRLVATLQGHTGCARGLALRGDGRLLASGSVDATVKLWELPRGQVVATLQEHTGSAMDVALSDDGRVLASAGEDGTLKLWEVAPASGSPGRLLATLYGYTGAVLATALSGDGHLLVSGSMDGLVRVWAAARGQLLATLRGHTGAVWAVALSADGRLVASGSIDGTVRVWAAASGQLLATLRGHSEGVRGVALSADGRVVASAGEEGLVRLWEVSTGHPLATVQGHAGLIHGVALSGDGQTVASAGEDGTVRLWAAPSGQLLTTLRGHTGAPWAVALSGDGRLVASGGFDGTVRLWAAPGGRALATLQGHAGTVLGVALSADEQVVASGGVDGMVRLWEPSSGACRRVLQAERCYERLDITGLSGVTEAQRAALVALGAVDRGI